MSGMYIENKELDCLWRDFSSLTAENKRFAIQVAELFLDIQREPVLDAENQAEKYGVIAGYVG